MFWWDIIGIVLTFIPIINRIGHRMLERNMEVSIKPLTVGAFKQTELKPAIEVKSSIKSGKPYITIGAVFNLELINHRTDRTERIVECFLELKERHWLLSNRTIISIPISGNGNIDKPFNNLELKPLSEPVLIEIKIYKTLLVQRIPKKVQLLLRFKMVGPMRRREILLGIF